VGELRKIMKALQPGQLVCGLSFDEDVIAVTGQIKRK
jgi:hypothetical protein